MYELDPAQWFEGAMLVCFGISWPVAIVKTLRTRRTEGKSLGFLSMIFLGYIAGILAKFIRAPELSQLEIVTALYALNAIFVGTEVLLYLKYRPKPEKPDLSNPTLP